MPVVTFNYQRKVSGSGFTGEEGWSTRRQPSCTGRSLGRVPETASSEDSSLFCSSFFLFYSCSRPVQLLNTITVNLEFFCGFMLLFTRFSGELRRRQEEGTFNRQRSQSGEAEDAESSRSFQHQEVRHLMASLINSFIDDPAGG